MSALRKQVSLQVFTLLFEDGACRETRAAAEELAETTSRLSVEINEAGGSGDLLRKFRVDATPSLVVTAKGAPDLRVYGVPTAYALTALLDALVAVGGSFDPASDLPERIRKACGDKPRPSVRLDLVASRRDPACAEASSVLWRVSVADQLAGGPLRLVSALRLVEDFPFWASVAPEGLPSGGTPFLAFDSEDALLWPFSDQDILDRLIR